MSRHILSLLLIACLSTYVPLALTGQSTGITYVEECPGDLTLGSGMSVVRLPSGNHLVFGIMNATENGTDGWDISMMKMNPQHECMWMDSLVWENAYAPDAATSSESPGSPIYADGGFVYLPCAISNPLFTNFSEVGLIKMDTLGNLIWRKKLTSNPGTDGFGLAGKILELPDGNVLVPIRLIAPVTHSVGYQIIDGQTGDQLPSPGTFGNDPVMRGVRQATDTTVFFLMSEDNIWSNGRPVIYEMNPYTGNVVKFREYVLWPYGAYGFMVNMVKNDLGYVLLTNNGKSWDTGPCMLIQTDHDLNVLYSKFYNEVGYYYGLHKNPDGSFLLYGTHNLAFGVNADKDISFMHLDQNLDTTLWRKFRIDDKNTPLYLEQNDTNIEMWGYSTSPLSKFILTIDEDCCISPQFEFNWSDYLVQNADSLQITFLPETFGLVDPNATFTWDFGDGQTETSTGNVSHVYETQGTYSVSVIAMTACGSDSASAMIEVICETVPDEFIVNTNGLTVACSFENTNPDWTVVWDFGDGNTSTELTPEHKYTQAGEYIICLDIINPCGPQTTCDTVSVVCPEVTLDLADIAICPNDTIVISPSGTYDQYIWSTGSMDPSIAINAPAIYTLTVSNTCGNMASDSFEVVHYFQENLEVFQSADTILTDDIFAFYQWYFNGNPIPNSNSFFYIPEVSGIYQLEVYDVVGCVLISPEIEFIVSSQKNMLEAGISIYPNPVSEQLFIETVDQRLIKVEMWTADGRLRLQKECNDGHERVGLDVANFPKGVCLVKITTDIGELQKLVLVH